MQRLVGLTKRAKSEWNAAYQWWAENRSAEQAARWYNAMADVIVALGEGPQRWPLARDNGRTVYELRERHFGLGRKPTHRILFTIRPEMVLVVSILHVAQRDFDANDE